MALNKDGLEAGSQVDFETMQRINKGRKNAESRTEEGSGKGKVHADEQQVQNTPKPTRKKKA